MLSLFTDLGFLVTFLDSDNYFIPSVLAAVLYIIESLGKRREVATATTVTEQGPGKEYVAETLPLR